MFPLKTRKIGGYAFKEQTFYNTPHLGVDYSASYVPLYAPFDGTATTSVGTQGGNTISFRPDGQNVCMRFMHLSKMSSGHFKEGEQIGVTGNTGQYSTAPHLHLDIATNWQGSYWNNINNFINPETFNWESDMLPNLDTNLLKYKDDGAVYYKFPSAEIFEQFTNKAWDKVQEIDKPVVIQEKTVTVEKIMPQIVEVNKLTEEEKSLVIEEFKRENPPTVKTEYVTVEPTIGELLIGLFNKIKNIRIGE